MHRSTLFLTDIINCDILLPKSHSLTVNVRHFLNDRNGTQLFHSCQAVANSANQRRWIVSDFVAQLAKDNHARSNVFLLTLLFFVKADSTSSSTSDYSLIHSFNYPLTKSPIQ